MAVQTYKTAAQVAAEAKRSNREFITYPPTYDFNNNKQRFISVEKNEQILAEQTRVITGYKKDGQQIPGAYDDFLNTLIDANYDHDVLVNFYNMLYYEQSNGDLYYKPLLAYALKSGATIHFNKIIKEMEANKNNVSEQKAICDQFYGQLLYATLQGVAREYYTMVIVARSGFEGKAAKSFMAHYDQMIKSISIDTDSSNTNYPEIIKEINNAIKSLRTELNSQKAEEITTSLNKKINGFTAKNAFTSTQSKR